MRIAFLAWRGQGARLALPLIGLFALTACAGPVPTETLRASADRHVIARLGELRREYGREKEPFEIHVISMDAYTTDGIKRLEDKGVTDAIVGFRNAYVADTMTVQQKVDALKGYADNVIAKL